MKAASYFPVQCLIPLFDVLDTAEVYKNEEDIGAALKAFLKKYNLERKDVFITSKAGFTTEFARELVTNCLCYFL